MPPQFTSPTVTPLSDDGALERQQREFITEKEEAAIADFKSITSKLRESQAPNSMTVPYAMRKQYSSAFWALPKTSRESVMAASTLPTPTFSRTPFPSSMTYPYLPDGATTTIGQYIPNIGRCGLNGVNGVVPAYQTIPTEVAQAMSAGNITSTEFVLDHPECFQTAYTTSSYSFGVTYTSSYFKPIVTLGSDAFTASMDRSATRGPCPAFYTMDIAFPVAEGINPADYTTVQFEDVRHSTATWVNGICCPMATNTRSLDTWTFSGTVCLKPGPTRTTFAIPYHINWEPRRHTFATTTVSTRGTPYYVSTFMFSSDNYDPSYTTPAHPGITILILLPRKTEASSSGSTDNSGTGRIIYPVLGAFAGFIFLACLAAAFKKKKETGSFYPTRRGRAPASAPAPTSTATTTPTTQPQLPGIIPHTTADFAAADPPPLYSPDIRPDEIALSRLDPNARPENVDRVSWTHLEIPSPGYATSGAGSVQSGGSDTGRPLIPAEPAPAYTVLRD